MTSTPSTRRGSAPADHAASGCVVPAGDPLFQRYHDLEWGMPVAEDTLFFEKVCLEGFQAGLSWRTILHRRDTFRRAFDGFDLPTVAAFTAIDVDRLCGDASIIRNRRKIEAVVSNARQALQLQQEFGSLAAFFWQFEPPAEHRPATLTPQWLADNPSSAESKAMTSALKARGWRQVGPTSLYALMQYSGIVNDHVEGCPCRTRIEAARRVFVRPSRTS